MRDIFIAKLEDRHHDVREVAIRALTEIYAEDADALQAVAELIEHEDADTRATVIFRLGKNGSAAALDAVRNALLDTHRNQLHDRYWLLRALNLLAAKHQVPDLLVYVQEIATELTPARQINEHQQDVRSHTHGIMYQALQFAMRYGTAAQLQDVVDQASTYQAPMLKTLIDDAIKQMAAMDASNEVDLATLMNTPTDDQTTRVFRRLQRLLAGPRESSEAQATPNLRANLTNLAVNGDTLLRPLAVQSLVHVFPADDILEATLLGLLSSPHVTVRTEAYGALVKHFNSSEKLLERIVKLLKSDDVHAACRGHSYPRQTLYARRCTGFDVGRSERNVQHG